MKKPTIREAAKALIAILPHCSCGKVAMWMQPEAPDMDGGPQDPDVPCCDEHVGKGHGICCNPYPVEYASALRELLEVLGGEK